MASSLQPARAPGCLPGGCECDSIVDGYDSRPSTCKTGFESRSSHLTEPVLGDPPGQEFSYQQFSSRTAMCRFSGTRHRGVTE